MRELRADVHLHAAQADVFELGGAGVERGNFFDGDAKLVFVGAGGDFFVGFGVHVGVHADGDGRDFLELAGDAVDALEFRFAFHVETVNAFAQGEGDFVGGFAHAGEYAFFRVPARGNGALDFAAADGVKATAQIGERAQDAEVGIGFHRKTNQMIQRRERVAEFGEVVSERFGGVNVERRAMLLGERGNGNALAMEPTVDVTKIVHARLWQTGGKR